MTSTRRGPCFAFSHLFAYTLCATSAEGGGRGGGGGGGGCGGILAPCLGLGMRSIAQELQLCPGSRSSLPFAQALLQRLQLTADCLLHCHQAFLRRPVTASRSVHTAEIGLKRIWVPRCHTFSLRTLAKDPCALLMSSSQIDSLAAWGCSPFNAACLPACGGHLKPLISCRSTQQRQKWQLDQAVVALQRRCNRQAEQLVAELTRSSTPWLPERRQ